MNNKLKEFLKGCLKGFVLMLLFLLFSNLLIYILNLFGLIGNVNMRVAWIFVVFVFSLVPLMVLGGVLSLARLKHEEDLKNKNKSIVYGKISFLCGIIGALSFYVWWFSLFFSFVAVFYGIKQIRIFTTWASVVGLILGLVILLIILFIASFYLIPFLLIEVWRLECLFCSENLIF